MNYTKYKDSSPGSIVAHAPILTIDYKENYIAFGGSETNKTTLSSASSYDSTGRSSRKSSSQDNKVPRDTFVLQGQSLGCCKVPRDTFVLQGQSLGCWLQGFLVIKNDEEGGGTRGKGRGG